MSEFAPNSLPKTLAAIPSGGSQQAILAILVAPGESWFWTFGLYALADKSTAFMGPLVVAGLAAVTDSQRLSLSAIPCFFVLGGLILLGVADTTGKEKTAAHDASTKSR